MPASPLGAPAEPAQTPPHNPTGLSSDLLKFRLLVEGSTAYAMFLITPDGRIASWNEGARRILGYEAAEVVGKPAALIFTPEDQAGGVPERELATAAREGCALDLRWHQRKDGSRFWADGVLERLFDEAGNFKGFAKVLRDATSEKETAQRLVQSEDNYRTLFDTIDVGFCVIEVIFDGQGQPVDYLFVEANPAFERHTGLVNGVGKTAKELVPNLDEFWFRTYGKVARTGEPARLENHAPAMERWFDVYALRVGPSEEPKVAVLFTDVTARKTAQEALRQSEEQLRDAQTRLEAALSAGEIATWTYDVVNNRVVADANLARLFSVAPHAAAGGELGVYLQAIHPDDRARVTDTIGEAIVNKNDYEAEYRVVLPNGSLRWLVARGKVERNAEGKTLALPGVVVDITARKELEQKQERLAQEQAQLLVETRARAERESLLNQIGMAVRHALEPEAILSAAVAALGQGLGVDRCYFVRYDQSRDTARVFPEWLRAEANLQPLVGQRFQMSSYSVDRNAEFKAGRTHVIDDVVTYDPDDADPLLNLSIRSMLRVPIEVGEQMTALTVAMANEPRIWSNEEVRLVENVASLLRTVLETAHIQQRERTIAQQLQSALQPPPPPSVPSLTLEGYYRPALAEAGVGGDFYDVFPLKNDCTALVVGDLSGKGLAAASEVATVRNMMRYALYSSATVADAVTGLNRILSENNLLAGFSTLFVGVYDQSEHTLTYANCGQEPGLIWRSETGNVDYLPPTGAVLGGFDTDAGYEQETVFLSSGDVLALFTDGLTEVGPHRKDLLQLEGVSDLLRRCCADGERRRDPRAIMECLINRVDSFAHGGVRDDIALLIGVVAPPTL